MKFEIDPRLKPYAVPIGLSAGLVLLIIVILIEWFAFRHGLAQENKTSRGPNPETLGAAITLEGLALPPVIEFSETVERPLFMETRRPSPPPLPGPPAKSEPPAPVSIQLMGVIESPKGRLALIAEAKGKYRRLRLKDAIDGWEVTEIRDDRLFLQQGELKQDIGLTKRRARTSQDKSAQIQQDNFAKQPPPQAPNPQSQQPDDRPEQQPRQPQPNPSAEDQPLEERHQFTDEVIEQN